jgi:hypothetical protein
MIFTNISFSFAGYDFKWVELSALKISERAGWQLVDQTWTGNMPRYVRVKRVSPANAPGGATQ